NNNISFNENENLENIIINENISLLKQWFNNNNNSIINFSFSKINLLINESIKTNNYELINTLFEFIKTYDYSKNFVNELLENNNILSIDNLKFIDILKNDIFLLKNKQIISPYDDKLTLDDFISLYKSNEFPFLKLNNNIDNIDLNNLNELRNIYIEQLDNHISLKYKNFIFYIINDIITYLTHNTNQNNYIDVLKMLQNILFELIYILQY